MKYLILLGICAGTVAATVWASTTGLGVGAPMRTPISVREGSAADNDHRDHRFHRRRFIGGGFHAGK